MNLCTDQLLMLVAAPEQVRALSHLASDDTLAVMNEEAAKYPVNHGRAEEIYLMKPDLILAGTFTRHTSINLLRELGIRVEQFSPVRSLNEIPANLRKLGAIIGREEAAERLVEAFENELALAKESARTNKVPAAVYYANSYTSGDRTLMNEVMSAAGLENIAKRLNLSGTKGLPLELLVMEAPEVLITAREMVHPPALAHEVLRHPALYNTIHSQGEVAIDSKYTICGLPFVNVAVEMLRIAGDRVARTPEEKQQ
ncbi:ABC transporter substrate-binding protein [Pseudovibrio sp. SPO723]|uniref:ABC transporter substrate-binding protein n=1 Tax=Nesiotobacter zosterae TaxID=392721 RepID=UPI0029C32F67|nr:ABC transporter substrate-binding protein [Pseudovibrio sp. SPO723]MDX5591938.1 ABC transporter substrate-binding protein [Pseudovibrio sp. SPO723]